MRFVEKGTKYYYKYINFICNLFSIKETIYKERYKHWKMYERN